MTDDTPQPAAPKAKEFALLTAAFGAMRPVHPNEDVIPLLAKTGAPNFQYRTFERPAPPPPALPPTQVVPQETFEDETFDVPGTIEAPVITQTPPETSPAFEVGPAPMHRASTPPVRPEVMRRTAPPPAPPAPARDVPPHAPSGGRGRGLRLADIFRGPAATATDTEPKKRSLREIFGHGGRAR